MKSEMNSNDTLEVELNHGHHLHWSNLDIDLELESLNNPENYPKIYK